MRVVLGAVHLPVLCNAFNGTGLPKRLVADALQCDLDSIVCVHTDTVHHVMDVEHLRQTAESGSVLLYDKV